LTTLAGWCQVLVRVLPKTHQFIDVPKIDRFSIFVSSSACTYIPLLHEIEAEIDGEVYENALIVF
jgi:hypothetical protein